MVILVGFDAPPLLDLFDNFMPDINLDRPGVGGGGGGVCVLAFILTVAQNKCQNFQFPTCCLYPELGQAQSGG